MRDGSAVFYSEAVLLYLKIILLYHAALIIVSHIAHYRKTQQIRHIYMALK